MSGFIGRSVQYSIGIFVPKLVGFALLPLYTRFLTPADYGVIAVLDMVGAYFGLVINSGFASALLRYYHQDEDRAWRNKVFLTTITVTTTLGLVGLAVTVPAADYLSLLAFESNIYGLYLSLILATVAVEVLNYIVVTLLRAQEKARLFMIIALVRICIAVPLNVYLIAFLQIGIMGFILSGLITALVVAATFGLRVVIQNWHWPDRKLAREILGFALPFVPAGLIEAFLNNLGILALTMTGNLTAAGLYAFGQKLASIISIAFTPIGTIWTPQMFKLAKREDAPAIYAQVTTLIFFLLSCPVVFMGTFADEVVDLMTEDSYNGAAMVIFPLAIGHLFIVLLPTVRIGLTLARKTFLIPVFTGIPAGLGFPLTLWAAHNYGAFGVACAISLIMISTLLLTGWASAKSLKVPYEWSRLARIGLALCVCYGLGSQIPQGWYVTKILCIGSFPLLVYLLGVMRPDEKQMLVDYLDSRNLLPGPGHFVRRLFRR